MPVASRRALRTVNTWPGFVDALAALLMVIMFLLMVFVLAQFFLNDALSGRDAALDSLRSRVNELADLLNLERRSSEDLRANLTSLSSDLQAALTARDQVSANLRVLSDRAAAAETRATDMAAAMALLRTRTESAEARADAMQTTLAATTSRADDAESRIADLLARLAAAESRTSEATDTLDAERRRAAEADERARSVEAALAQSQESLRVERDVIEVQEQRLAELLAQVVNLQALKQELEAEVARLGSDARDAEARYLKEAELSESGRAEVARLNQQLTQLRADLDRLNRLLAVAEADITDKKIEIRSLGARLNAALADKVEELSRYRSEFFGRLSEILGDEGDIRIVGDRFVFQSEVLFASGSAEIDAAGRAEIRKVGESLKQLTELIPEEIPWVLQVNGHTDAVPIRAGTFASNWELSMARALSVVDLLTQAGFPASRVVAAGFGEHQPLDTSGTEEANRRNRRIELKLTQP